MFYERPAVASKPQGPRDHDPALPPRISVTHFASPGVPFDAPAGSRHVLYIMAAAAEESQ